MKEFLTEDFLLSNPTSQKLYDSYAKNTPILDYHCHINPQEIFEDRKYDNITQVWLGADHYKWRQMRSNGIDEKYITGEMNAITDYDQFFCPIITQIQIELIFHKTRIFRTF